MKFAGARQKESRGEMEGRSATSQRKLLFCTENPEENGGIQFSRLGHLGAYEKETPMEV